MIWKMTGVMSSCSGCNARARQMNEWGWLGCLRNRQTIYDWMTQEARARGHVVEKPEIRELFLAAISELKGERKAE
jgi:predicted Fe-S protein YdhL (DUF1289 family)